MTSVRNQSIEVASVDGGRASDVSVNNIGHSYGSVEVLKHVSLDIEHGELLTLLGPSGSGKSTLLRIIGGLERPTTGSVAIGGHDVTAVPTERRDIGIVFQNYALFPHMSVAENVGFPLRMRRVSRAQARKKVESILDLVGLGAMKDRRPTELSGGQQQRVAIARALVFEPRVLLLDEPFGALDRRLREQLGLEVRRVQRELGITTIFVTHDQDEAFTLSTRIAVMGEGKLLQVGTPSQIYDSPADLDVARSLGNLNEFVCEVERRGTEIALRGPDGLRFEIPPGLRPEPGTAVTGAVRPEHLDLAPTNTPDNANGQVRAAIFSGDSLRVQVITDSGVEILVVLPAGSANVADGDLVSVSVRPDHLLVFGMDGDRVGERKAQAESIKASKAHP